MTNGTLLDDAIADFIVQESIGLEVSIDGPPEIHDCNRPYLDGTGSFHTVHANLLKFATRYPDYKIHIFSVITAVESLPWLHSLLQQFRKSAFTFNPVYVPPDQEKDWGGNHRDITRRALKKRIEIHRQRFLEGNAEHDEGLNCQLSCFLSERIMRACEVGVNTTITTQSGKIYPCPFFVGYEDQVIGHVTEGFYPEKVRAYIGRTVDSLESCRGCRVKDFCGGGCAFEAYERNGRIDVPFRQSCVATRQYAEELHKSIIILGSKRPEALLDRVIERSVRDPRPQANRARRGTHPESFVIRLTGRCNLACDYCFEREKDARDDYLDVSTARSIAEYILASPCREPLVCLFGGEPLLNWETARFLLETLTKAMEKERRRPFFHIATNGTLITEHIAETIARYRVTVQISIDGGRKEHDRHRQYPDGRGSYDEILRGMAILRGIDPDVKIDAQAVLTPGNTDMVNIVKDLISKGFRRICFLKCASVCQSSVQWSVDDIRKLGEAREEFFPFFLESVREGRPDIDMNFAALVAAEPGGTEGLCECGAGEVYIDTAGNIYPCPLVYSTGNFLLGNCASRTPKGRMQFAPGVERIDPDCSQCWAYTRCRGGCAVHCQRCPWIPSSPPAETQRLWCDLMRAEFARAIIANRLLEQHQPEALKALRSIFTA